MPVPIETKVDLAPRRLLRDTVAESIRSAILDGSFRPGERLHDEELQNWLGVSRTPIRDALNELSRAGLIEMAPNRYTRVADPDSRDAANALETIAALLSGVLRIAVPRMTPSERRECSAGMDRILREFANHDAPALGEACRSVLSAAVRVCDNRVLGRLYDETMWGLVFRVRVGYETADLRESVQRMYEDLRNEVMLNEHHSISHRETHHATTPSRRPAAAAH
jgi:DNA-binding GntR family transcriptional regulator